MRRIAAVTAFVLASSFAASASAAPSNNPFDAAAIDDLRDVTRLVERMPDRNASNEQGDTLLIVAIRNDAGKVADRLIADPTVDVERTNTAGETALMIAAYRKNQAVVEKLIDRGAEVNRVGWTALHYAASVDAGDIVAVLLDHAAYIDAESPNRTTPLMMAARGGFDGLAHRLVEAGADPTPVNDRDLDAAGFARRANDPALAEWLDGQSVAWRAKYGERRPRKAPPG